MNKKPVDKYNFINKNLKNIQENIILLYESYNELYSNFYEDQKIRSSLQTFVGDMYLMGLLNTENEENFTHKEKFDGLLSNISKIIENYKVNHGFLKSVESEVESIIYKKVFLTESDNNNTKKIGKHKKSEISVKEISDDLKSLLDISSKFADNIKEFRKIKCPVQTFIGDSVFSEILKLIAFSYGEHEIPSKTTIQDKNACINKFQEYSKEFFEKMDLNDFMGKVRGNLEEDIFKQNLDNIKKAVNDAVKKYKNLPPVLNRHIDSVHLLDTLDENYETL